MDLGENISQSFEFTKKLLEEVGDLILLIVVAAIPVVNLILLGYCARVIRETPSADRPPKLERFAELWVDGLKVVIVAVVWLIIPAVLGAAALTVAPLRALAPPLWPLTTIFVLGFWLAAALAALFVFGVLMMLGIAHMVKTEKLSKAFAVSELLGIIRKVGPVDYLVWYAAIFVLGLAVSSLGSLHWVISLAVSVPFAVFTARSLGLLYAEATGGGRALSRVP